MLTLVAFIVLIGVLITAHELGHFVVAKLFGVRVHTFSVGFGPAILSKTIGETEYRLAWLPLGGYVRLAGMAAEFDISEEEPQGEEPQGEEPQGKEPQGKVPRELLALEVHEEGTLRSKPAWARALIFVAGPAMNLLLPFALLPPVFLLSSSYDRVYTSRLGSVDEGGPAYAAGLRDGDHLVSLNGEPVESFWQVSRAVDEYDPRGGPIRAGVMRAGGAAPRVFEISPAEVLEAEGATKNTRKRYRVGLQPSPQPPYLTPTGDGLFAQAGGRTFDLLVSLNGAPLYGLGELPARLAALPPDRPVELVVERLTPIDEELTPLHRRERITLTLPPRLGGEEGALTTPEEVLARLGARPAGACVLSLDPSSPAAESLRVGDCLLAVGGERHSLPAFLDAALRVHPEEPKRVLRWRAGEEEEVEVRLAPEVLRDPTSGEEEPYWRLGFTLAGLTRAPLSGDLLVPNTFRWSHAWWQTREVVSSDLSRTLKGIKGLFVGEVSPKRLGGPVAIFYLAGREASAGWERFMFLMVSLSLSIALMNLLPVPGLDGGHILVSLVEMVTRRPLPLAARRALLVAGAVALVSLMLFVLVNDLLRMWQMSQGG